MRLRHRSSPLVALLLLSPFLVSALAEADPSSDQNAPLALRKRLTTDDAPVDGKDGKPHQGPFVDTTVDVSKDKQSTLDDITIKGRPKDITMHEGKKIPETNDGVMNDKPLKAPKIDGTEGGVSERTRDRKAKEQKTGEVAENAPIKLDDHPPVPSSEEDKMGKTKTKASPEKEKGGKADSGSDAPGFEKPGDLPELPHEVAGQPVPESAQKSHLDVNTGTSKNRASLDDGKEGLIQPLHSFLLSFTMIIFSEIGDKTFIVACLMAMKHDRMLVFSAAFSALITMTVLSAVLGHAVPTLIPKKLTNLLACVLFFFFGARLLKEGMGMDPNEGVSEEMHEVEQELAEKESKARGAGTVSAYDMEAGYGGHRKSRSASRLRSPRSPSSSPEAKPRKTAGDGGLKGLFDGINNLLSLLLSPAWVQTFVMTFLGEWGDRSQIATIAMAAGQDYWWVTLGAILGHACCTSVAVIGGRAIAGRVSLKVVTVGGAIAFLVFGFIYLIEGLYL